MRIDPRARRVVDTAGIGGTPGNLAAAEGRAWVSEACSMGGAAALLRFDAPTGPGEVWEEIPLDDLGLPVTATPLSRHGCGLAARGDSVWVATNNPPAAVRVDIDPATGDFGVVKVVPLARGPTAIAIGEGSIWIADETDVVRRLDTATGEVLAAIPVGSAPAAIAISDGDAWIANGGDDSVSRVDALANAVSRSIPVGKAPVAVAVGERAVWVANSGDGSVSRIDPRTNRVTATISVGHRPQDIAVAGGSVWVSVRP